MTNVVGVSLIVTALAATAFSSGCTDDCGGYDTSSSAYTGAAVAARDGQVAVVYRHENDQKVLFVDADGNGEEQSVAGGYQLGSLAVGRTSAAFLSQQSLGGPFNVALFDGEGTQTLTVPLNTDFAELTYDGERFVVVGRDAEGLHLWGVSEDGGVDSNEVLFPVETTGRFLNTVVSNDAGILAVQTSADDAAFGTFETYVIDEATHTSVRVVTDLGSLPVWFDGRFRLLGREEMTSISTTGEVETWAVDGTSDSDNLIATSGSLFLTYFGRLELGVADPTLHSFSATTIGVEDPTGFQDSILGFQEEQNEQGRWEALVRAITVDGASGSFERRLGTSGPEVHVSGSCDSDT